jgi:peptidoglycan/LPS O-acetylase OafA/YrhL
VGSIRLFLAFAVLVSHAVALDIDILPATVAVQSFFIISGFYMSLILNEKYEGYSLFVFYTNRFLRLFPTYLFVLLLSFTVLCAFDLGIFTRYQKFQQVLTNGPVMALSYLWVNIAIMGQDLLFLLGVDIADYSFYWDISGNASVKAWSFLLVPQAWSLSMELYFYLLAPFILRRRVRWVAGLFLASLGVRLFIVSRGPEYDLFLRRFFPAELCLFLSGYFSYLLFKHIRHCDRKYFMGLSSWAVLLCVLVLYDKINANYSLALLAITMTLLMPFIFNLAKDNKVDRLLGNISFPIYMVHFLVIEVIDDYIDEYSLWMLLPLILVVALAVYYGIEVPVDH